MADHSQVAHVWAQGTGRSARGFNMYADGPAVFSYGAHFCIARFVDTTPKRGGPAQRRVVLFNADGYSTSTAKHKSHVRRAIPSGVKVYTVPGAGLDHAANLAFFQASAVESFRKAKRARTYAAMHERDAAESLDDAESYAADFGLRWKRPATLDSLVAEAEARAKREAAARRKAEREAERARAAREAAQRIQDAERFARWQSGEPVACPTSYYTDAHGSAYMRVVSDELQTSQGASVPLAHAVRAFRFIKLCHERGESWKRNGRTIRVGHFQIDEITPDGMRAGCHSFTWERIAEAARAAGVADIEADAAAVEASAA